MAFSYNCNLSFENKTLTSLFINLVLARFYLKLEEQFCIRDHNVYIWLWPSFLYFSRFDYHFTSTECSEKSNYFRFSSPSLCTLSDAVASDRAPSGTTDSLPVDADKRVIEKTQKLQTFS